MACMEPFAQITGTAKIYLAPERTAPPAITAQPGVDWIYLGETDGDQSVEHAGELTLFRTNERTGPLKAIRPEEDVTIGFTLVETTLENYARVLHHADLVTNSTVPVPAKHMPFKRGACPTVYALLMIGDADSPYGLYPAYNYFPRVVSNAEPEVTRAKDDRRVLECSYTVLEDPQQTAGNEMGWAVAQTGAA